MWNKGNPPALLLLLLLFVPSAAYSEAESHPEYYACTTDQDCILLPTYCGPAPVNKLKAEAAAFWLSNIPHCMNYNTPKEIGCHKRKCEIKPDAQKCVQYTPDRLTSYTGPIKSNCCIYTCDAGEDGFCKDVPQPTKKCNLPNNSF